MKCMVFDYELGEFEIDLILGVIGRKLVVKMENFLKIS